jgi:hypothetical protein
MFEVNFSLEIHKIYFANVMLIHELTRHWLPSKYPPGNSNQFNFYAMHIMSSVARRTCLVSLFEKCWQVKHLRCKLTSSGVFLQICSKFKMLMFFWHFILVQWIKSNRIYFAVLRMWIATNFPISILPSSIHFCTFSPTDMDAMPCHLWTNRLFSTQNHTQPATTLNWANLDTFQACDDPSFSLWLLD